MATVEIFWQRLATYDARITTARLREVIESSGLDESEALAALDKIDAGEQPTAAEMRRLTVASYDADLFCELELHEDTGCNTHALEIIDVEAPGLAAQEHQAGDSLRAQNKINSEEAEAMSGQTAEQQAAAPEFTYNGTRHQYTPAPDAKYPSLQNPACSCGWRSCGYVRNWLALHYWEQHRAEFGHGKAGGGQR